MSRYRLLPTPAQEAVLRDHCAHARYVWNLAVEQHWRAGRAAAPGYLEQCRQLTAARAAHPWLSAGSQTVQQQALRDFAQAMSAFADPRQARIEPPHACEGGEDQARVHEPAVLGVRAGGREVAREPSRLPVHCLRFRLQR